jgi:YidC/Oxa1 family membrane protein insertase
MNKTDRIIVAILFCVLIAWSFYGRKFSPRPQPPTEQPVAEVGATTATGQVAQAASTNLTAEAPAPTTEPELEIAHEQSEQLISLTNEVVALSFTTWGGGIKSAELSQYPATMEKDSGPVVLDFTGRPALSYTGLEGLSAPHDVDIQRLTGVNGLRIERRSESGLVLTRTILLTNGYQVAVADSIANPTDEAVAISQFRMSTGPMATIETKAKTQGISYLGADTLGTTEGRVTPWGKKLSGLFGVKGGCSSPDLRGLPVSQTLDVDGPLAWVGVKNKFFAQVLEPADGSPKCRIYAGREASDSKFSLNTVSAELEFPATVLEPNGTLERSVRYYVGPKKFSELSALGNKQDHIMLRSWKGWGWWRLACIGLLWLLNFLKLLTFNYGIAIILLTIIVKIVFWPLTHKGTENMKKMQKLQPQLSKLREKFKNDPKKLQEKQMLLYRENGVNPLAGCLPMFVQMPVFIALFTVLRSAVELRFASFLWIADLSEPEGLLAGVLPFPAGGLNLLPLAMTGTMILQQRLTPSAGDPQQQKMMQFMPVMMLFIFYNMASALVLYWTVSQVLSIVQLLLQQRKEKALA